MSAIALWSYTAALLKRNVAMADESEALNRTVVLYRSPIEASSK